MPAPSTPFEIADRLVEDVVAIDPVRATTIGVPGHDHEWPDLAPEGRQRAEDLYRSYRDLFLAHHDHPERSQRLAARVLAAWLEERIAGFEAGDHLRDLSHMASSFQTVREVFDLQPRDSVEQWAAVCARLETVDRPLRGLWQTLEAGLARGIVQSRRQVLSVLDQAEELAGRRSAWLALLPEAASGFPEVEPRLQQAIDRAREAVAGFAERLRTVYLPRATPEDGAGPERYVREADRQVGGVIDPLEVYAWGWSEIARIRSELEEVAAQIDPDASVEEVVHVLETDPGRAAHSAEQLVAFVADRQEQAVEDLAGVHFDVPDRIARVTVHVAPPGGAIGVYYHPPSEDFSRPGSIWYSVGDQASFPLYQEVSTAYHEGFPGHHLQIGTTMVQRERLSRAQRLLVWYAGYGEGWALYTERLMQELGYFEKPDYVFGMLASHIFRATRVVVDIGLHLGLDIPDAAPLHPGRRWSFDLAVDYMRRVGMQVEPYAVSEVVRYLGWPGQAISYKVGERAILDLRDEARRRHPSFDLADFHRRVLRDGEMRLDLLREVVLDW